MSKKFIKIKELREFNRGNLYSVRYCQLQHLLSCVEPQYYFSSIEGWRFDVYLVGGLIITTGYDKPRIKDIKKFDDNVIEVYESKAKDIIHNNNSFYDTKKELINLLHEFCIKHGGF